MVNTVVPFEMEQAYHHMALETAQSKGVFDFDMFTGGFCDALSLKVCRMGMAYTTEYLEKSKSVDTIESGNFEIINVKDYTAGDILPAGAHTSRIPFDILNGRVNLLARALRRRLDGEVVKALIASIPDIPAANILGDGTKDLDVDMLSKVLGVGSQKNLFQGERRVLIANSDIASELMKDPRAINADYVAGRPISDRRGSMTGFLGSLWGFDIIAVPDLAVKSGLATDVIKIPNGGAFGADTLTGVFCMSVGDMVSPIGWAYNLLKEIDIQKDPYRASGIAINMHMAAGVKVISPKEIILVKVKKFDPTV